MNHTKVLESINIYFNEEISIEILNGLKEFTTTYVDVNECPFLSDDIFNMKLTELLDVFKNSNHIIEGINNNTIEPCNLCKLKPQELNPARYAALKGSSNALPVARIASYSAFNRFNVSVALGDAGSIAAILLIIALSLGKYSA